MGLKLGLEWRVVLGIVDWGVGAQCPDRAAYAEPGLCCNTLLRRCLKTDHVTSFTGCWVMGVGRAVSRGGGVNNFQMPAQDMHYIIIMPQSAVRSIRLRQIYAFLKF